VSTIALIITAIIAALKFPDTLRAFLLLLEKTPEEKHQEILDRIKKESEDLDKGGRPKWES